MKLFLPYYAISIFGLFIASWHFDDDLLKAIMAAQMVSLVLLSFLLSMKRLLVVFFAMIAFTSTFPWSPYLGYAIEPVHLIEKISGVEDEHYVELDDGNVVFVYKKNGVWKCMGKRYAKSRCGYVLSSMRNLLHSGNRSDLRP